MIRLTTNFEFNSDMPLDYRMNFETIDEMMSFPETDVPLGLFSTVKANKTTYQFVGKDICPDTNGWKEVFREGNFLVTADGIEYKNPNTGSTAVTVQAGMDELRKDLNNHVKNCLWREPLSSLSDLPPIGNATYGEAHVVGGKSIYIFDGTQWVNLIDTHIINDATILNSGLMPAGDKVKVDKIIISDAGDKFLANDGTYRKVTAQLSETDAAKLAAIVTDGTGTKFLANDGKYYIPNEVIALATQTLNGLMSKEDKIKVDMLQNTGLSSDGNKLLSADGTYHVIDSLSTDDRTKLDKIKIDEPANVFLNGQGQYTKLTATLPTADQEKLDAIKISTNPSDANTFLAADGTYKTISGSISDDEKGKINKIITTGDGSKFLSDNGTYKTVTGVSAEDQAKIDKLIIDGDANKFLAADGTYKEIDLAKADTAVGANDGNDGLMSKEDKAKVDVIQVSVNPGDENLFLAKDGTYKAISGGGSGDGLTQDQKDKLDKIIIDDPDGELFLANDGEYKDVTDFIPLADNATDGLMSKNDKTNLDSLVTQIKNDGKGDLFLSDDGYYKAITGVSAQDQAKLDKIITNDPNGKLFLANDGNYKNVTPFVDLVTTTTDGLMKATDKVSLDKVTGIVKDNAGANLFLAGDGTYKTVVATATTIAAANTTYDNTKANKLTSTNVQDAIDEILTDMPSIDDTAASTDFTKLLSAGKIYDLLDGKANETHTHVCADITDLTSKYYDIKTIDQKIADVTTGVIWKESVATYTDIATTYPSPETGWLVATLDTQQIYRYNGTTWEKFGSMAIQSEATHTEKGLMSAADKVKLDAIDETAPRIYYQSATPPLINGTIWVEE